MNDAGRIPPTLERLGRDLERAYAAEEAKGRVRRRRQRRRWSVAVALIALAVVPTAVATRSLWAPRADRTDPGRPAGSHRAVVVAEDLAAAEPWRLGAFASNGGICLQLSVLAGTGTRSTVCGAPDRRALDATLLAGPSRWYVFGRAPAAARLVRVVSPDGQAVDVPAVTPSGRARETLTTAPPGMRVYVAVFDAPVRSLEGLSAEAQDGRGRRIARYPR
jgi:hypothetical protein